MKITKFGIIRIGNRGKLKGKLILQDFKVDGEGQKFNIDDLIDAINTRLAEVST
jgi:hypothetical protein